MAGAISGGDRQQRRRRGGIFNPSDDPVSQLGDILEPRPEGCPAWDRQQRRRTYKGARGSDFPFRQKYDLGDEGLALLGWRVSTYDPKASLYYKSFGSSGRKLMRPAS